MRTFLFIAVVGLMLAVILENVNATGKNSPTKELIHEQGNLQNHATGQSPPDSPNHKNDHENEISNLQNRATGQSPPDSTKRETEHKIEKGKPSPDSPKYDEQALKW
uniref:Putative gland protein G23G12 n=2 Tax=Heterodera glycines TaxID=51029 RepID=Q86DF0_HETGL|nr:putative gland protein G23G12 [Heterodera glycines]